MLSRRPNASASYIADNPTFLNISHDLMEDWLNVLVEHNNSQMSVVSIKLNSQLVQFVFHICNLLNQPCEVRYLTIELLKRFIPNHVTDMYNHVRTNYDVTRQSSEWSALLGRLRRQLPLRVLSCCRIASKLTSHCRTISGVTMRSLLSDLGLKYSTNGVFESELRVLRTLNYHMLLKTPLIYIDTLLQHVEFACRLSNVLSYRAVCIDVLDVTYFKWKDVSEQLVYAKASRPADVQTGTDRLSDSSGAGCEDYLLLAAAVISCASYLLDQSLTDTIVEELSKVTLVNVDAIMDLAIVLVHQSIIIN